MVASRSCSLPHPVEIPYLVGETGLVNSQCFQQRLWVCLGERAAGMYTFIVIAKLNDIYHVPGGASYAKLPQFSTCGKQVIVLQLRFRAELSMRSSPNVSSSVMW